jgi:hypothetical protein
MTTQRHASPRTLGLLAALFALAVALAAQDPATATLAAT